MTPSLMDVHGALSNLVFAVRQNLEPLWTRVHAEWQNGTYLSVVVECRGKNVQEIADRLSHGVLQGDYDYRFSVSYPTSVGPNDWVEVRAYPRLS